MRTVKEVSRETGVSVRALHYYDEIGLLRPTRITDAGYRLYDDEALAQLWHILFLRRLRFSLRDIMAMMSNPRYDRQAALDTQLKLLHMQREQLDGLIAALEIMKKTGGMQTMDFTLLDNATLKAYEDEARAQWCGHDAWREYEEKQKHRTPEAMRDVGVGLMACFAELGTKKSLAPESDEAQEAAGRLRAYITDHFYSCTPQIFRSLSEMYVRDERMRKRIDEAGGEGCAAFASKAIAVYCDRLGSV